ncbi:uncharacterized protein LOC126366611 [Pectinophora gossypiella]|uniref:uncharacterized protein LOC126366611 n=1 Tax=Pectinophora gossypiella TaxID=13191 RepID=UPI00214DFCB3|nr:uncharacterized protein LOC126366611 [Pectinophora gossypiella]
MWSAERSADRIQILDNQNKGFRWSPTSPQDRREFNSLAVGIMKEEANPEVRREEMSTTYGWNPPWRRVVRWWKGADAVFQSCVVFIFFVYKVLALFITIIRVDIRVKMHRLSLLLVCACALAAASRINYMDKPIYPLEEVEMHFEAFIKKFNRSYSSEAEKKMRLEIFKTHLEKINRQNMDPDEHATFDITKFADLTEQEFIQQYTGLDTSLHVPGPKVNVSGPVTMDLPDNFDWREKNVVTPVKDQGQCGSCWAFSTTGSIEAAYARKHTTLVLVSEQQLVDCDKTSKGCNGGLMRNALKYLQGAGGIESEDDYPYVATDGDCKFDGQKVAVKITGQKPYNLNDEEALRQTLVSDGPVSIAVDATDFQTYHRGILKSCRSREINHGVLLVGFGTESGVPFWIIKNSWGAGWGEKGYIRVKRGNNPCSILNDLAVTAEVAYDAEMHFEAFIEKFNRSYTSEAEKKAKLEVFKKNLEKINRQNMDPDEHATFDMERHPDSKTTLALMSANQSSTDHFHSDIRVEMYRLSLLLVFACALAAASRINNMDKPIYPLEEAEIHFDIFIEKFNRSYSSKAEKKSRFEIFKKNLEDINRKNMNPHELATFDINMFADLSEQEAIQQYTGLDTSRHVSGPSIIVSGPVSIDLPENFDWREKNVVTPVKNQGLCGSCWAFSTTGTIEGAYARKHSSLIAVSEQQLVDCDTNDSGCQGGFPIEALKYLKKVGGIQSEDTYPYTAKDEKCKFDPKKIAVKITDLKPYNLTDEEALRQTLVSDGPISIGVDSTGFISYQSGILKKCESHNLNHGVLLVGYGTENGVPFWIIKNSWGVGWGEKGYLRVKRGNNPCGLLNDQASTAVVG